MKKRKTTLKEAREKEAIKYQKKIAELEAQLAEKQIDKEAKKPEESKAKDISIVHKFRPNPLRWANYFELKSEYSYYWHDIVLIERQGWGIWERVDKSNHKVFPKTRIHADGSIRVGTAIACYAPIEDVMAQRVFNAERSKSTISNLEKAQQEEMERIFAEHGKQYGGVKGVGEKIEEKRY